MPINLCAGNCYQHLPTIGLIPAWMGLGSADVHALCRFILASPGKPDEEMDTGPVSQSKGVRILVGGLSPS